MGQFSRKGGYIPAKEAANDSAPIEITRELNSWANGDPEALNRAFPELYLELRRLAESRLWEGNRARTLTASDLLHEAYLRLVRTHATPFKDRAAFFSFAATIMHSILVDRARKASAAKRQTPKNSADVKANGSGKILAVHDAIMALHRIDPELANIANLKYFGGLTIPEMAKSLEFSEATVKRRWTAARTWLEEYMHAKLRNGNAAG